MQTLRHALPPANALVVFEAAARRLSFTQAAAELGVSQAAVSRQIQGLEQHLGIALFHRLHRAVRLTAEGERLRAAVTMGLGHIAETASTLRRATGPAEVTVSTTVAFAAFWLMPRIDRFYAAHPGLDLRLLASDTPVDPRSESIDVAVRYGDGVWPGLSALKLFEEEIFPVCSPAYLAGRPALREASDLLGEALLHQDVVEPSWLSWGAWLKQKGVAAPAKIPGPRVNNYTIVIQAAQAGQGIALGWHRLVAGMIEAGSLVRPIAATLQAKHAYYLVVPTGRNLPKEATAFRDWLVAEAAQSGR